PVRGAVRGGRAEVIDRLFDPRVRQRDGPGPEVVQSPTAHRLHSESKHRRAGDRHHQKRGHGDHQGGAPGFWLSNRDQCSHGYCVTWLRSATWELRVVWLALLPVWSLAVICIPTSWPATPNRTAVSRSPSFVAVPPAGLRKRLPLLR